MARPSLFRHRKFLLLCTRLGDDALALGSLEFIWAMAYESGDPLLGPPEVVEHAARWRGERGKLAAALVEAGFLDETPDGLAVHDLEDHEPDYVKARRRMETLRRERGTQIRQRVTRTRSEQLRNSSEHVRECSEQLRNGYGTPAPAPAPAPAPKKRERGTRATDGDAVVRSKARPSSVEEVRAYLAELGVRTFTAEAFIDWHEARGWRLRSGPVKDWRACVRTWARRDGAQPSRVPRHGEYLEGRCAECHRPSTLTICEDCQTRVFGHVEMIDRAAVKEVHDDDR